MHGSILLVPAVYALDLIIKNNVEKGLEYGNDHKVNTAGGHITLKRIHNYGAMFGRHKDKPGAVRTFSLLAGASTAVFYIYALGNAKSDMLKYGLALNLGGASSNIYDRCKRGYVVDYLLMGRYVWNISDLAIIAGTLLTVSAFKGSQRL